MTIIKMTCGDESYIIEYGMPEQPVTIDGESTCFQSSELLSGLVRFHEIMEDFSEKLFPINYYPNRDEIDWFEIEGSD